MQANAQAKGRKCNKSAGLKVWDRSFRIDGYGEMAVSSLPMRCQNAWAITSLSSLLEKLGKGGIRGQSKGM